MLAVAFAFGPALALALAIVLANATCNRQLVRAPADRVSRKQPQAIPNHVSPNALQNRRALMAPQRKFADHPYVVLVTEAPVCAWVEGCASHMQLRLKQIMVLGFQHPKQRANIQSRTC